jgi:hypothetical protein
MLDDWRVRIQGNAFLEEIYNYNRYDHLPPRKPNDKPYSTEEICEHEVEKFINFVRNAIAHRLQHQNFCTNFDNSSY